jgi:hypothetical protein
MLKSILTTAIILNCQLAKANYDYPELTVTPRATERLKIEAVNEDSDSFKYHLPVMIASLNTFVAGVSGFSDVDKVKDRDEVSPKVATAVGLGWLTVTSLMAMNYRPYASAIDKTNMIKGTDKRSQLIRERMAEEEIKRAARLGRTITWMSAFTNAAASGYMASKAKKDTTAKTAGSLGVLTAFAPLIFQYHWMNVRNEHESYKKKIYSPIVSNVIGNPFTETINAGVNLTWSFN